jgi:hypothetical protein
MEEKFSFLLICLEYAKLRVEFFSYNIICMTKLRKTKGKAVYWIQSLRPVFKLVLFSCCMREVQTAKCFLNYNFTHVTKGRVSR